MKTKQSRNMQEYKMYASGLITQLVCDHCEEKPCPHTSWLAKNGCPKIISYNEQLGKCCATCLHLIDERYCRKYRTNPDEDFIQNLAKYEISDDIFKHTCPQWSNTWSE